MKTVTDDKVLLIGWVGVGWETILHCLEQGACPNLEALIAKGVKGPLSPLYPMNAPSFWTSVITGKYPYRHDVFGYLSPAKKGAPLPFCAFSRKTRALWNMTTQSGRTANAIAWPGTFPAEPIRGAMVSDALFHGETSLPNSGPAINAIASNKTLARRARRAKLTSEDLRPDMLDHFIPPGLVDEKTRERLAALVADATSVNAAVEMALTKPDWSLTVVGFDIIARARRLFDAHVGEGTTDHEKWTLPVLCSYLDALLGATLESVPENATAIVVSDAPEGERHGTGDPRGFFAMGGGRTSKGEDLFAASPLDICPTILTILGLPVGGDMDGEPLLTAFEDPYPVSDMLSWDLRSGRAGTLSKRAALSPAFAKKERARLVAEGWVPATFVAVDSDAALEETRFAKARSLAQGEHPKEALALALSTRRDSFARDALAAACALALGDLDDARQRVKTLWERPDKDLDLGTAERLAGELRLAEGDADGALDHLRAAEKLAPEDPSLKVKIGETLLAGGNRMAAELALRKALKIDPDLASAYQALARTFLAKEEYDRAMEAAISAVGLAFRDPESHYLLGLACLKRNDIDDAVASFKLAAAARKDFVEALQALAEIYETHSDNAQKAACYRRLEQEARLARDAVKKS